MVDVRSVFFAFGAFALLALLILGNLAIYARGRAWFRRAVRRGAIILAVLVVVLGVLAAIAFDALFETFHELFFPAGSFDFAASSKLIQLFPDQFWFETSLLLAVVILGLSWPVRGPGLRRPRRAWLEPGMTDDAIGPDAPLLSVEAARERILAAIGDPLASEEVSVSLASGGSPPRPSGQRRTCRPGTTARWMATPYGPPTWLPPRSAGRSSCGSSARPPRAAPSGPWPSPGPRSGSRPARRSPPARTPWSRSS